jgi:predicted methyltransferase
VVGPTGHVYAMVPQVAEALVVLRDVEGAGFVFDGRSEVLTNPADPKTKIVFDPSIRGHTDQFAFKFRKPLA